MLIHNHVLVQIFYFMSKNILKKIGNMIQTLLQKNNEKESKRVIIWKIMEATRFGAE